MSESKITKSPTTAATPSIFIFLISWEEGFEE
jgi:hypothetical protein